MSGEAARQLSVCYREETRYFFGVSSETEKRTGFACPFSFLFSSGGSVKKAHQERVSFPLRPALNSFSAVGKGFPSTKAAVKTMHLTDRKLFSRRTGGRRPQPGTHKPPDPSSTHSKVLGGVGEVWRGRGTFLQKGSPPPRGLLLPRPTTSPPAQCRRRRCGRGWIRSSPLPRGTRRFADARQGGWPRCGPRPPQRWGGKRHLPSRISHLPA